MAMKATLDALPDVFRTLDTATVSFLKVRSFPSKRNGTSHSITQSLIPQLAHIMALRSTSSIQPTNVTDTFELQKSAGRVLLVIIEVGACRMEGWKFTILDCVARCWVGLVDFGTGGIGGYFCVLPNTTQC